MSKFGCTCGHVIRDQTDYLPYKGQVLKDQDKEAFFEGTASALVEYIAGVRAGDLAQWESKWSFLRGRPDGDVAWELIDWAERPYGVIISDLRMPGLGGDELLARLAERGMADRVVFLTGDTASEEGAQALAGVEVPVLAKPISVDELRRVLDEVAARTSA